MHVDATRATRATRRGRIVRRAILAALVPAAAVAADDKPGATLLPETVVTATRTAAPSREVGSALTVITGAELVRRQVTYVSDALRQVPGVAVNRTSGFGSSTDVRIRGAEANQTLVLIDGVKVNDPALSSQFNFGHLLTSDIERIEVLRGPQSVLYGSDAVGGVVNIITKKGDGSPRLSGSAEYGSFNTKQTSATVSAGNTFYDVALNGAFLETDGISAADARNGNTEEDGDRNKLIQGRFGLRPTDNVEIRLDGRWQGTKVDTDAFNTMAEDDLSFSKGIERYGRGEVKFSLFDKHWDHSFSGSLFDNKLKSDGGAFGASSTNGMRKTLAYQTDFRLDTPDVAAAKHTFSLGASGEREDVVTNSTFSSVDRTLKTTSLYGLYQVGLWDRMFLTGGGRHDDNDFFPDSTTFRLTGALQLPELGAKLHASGGTAVKNPTVFELYGFTSTFTGNPNLQPEKSQGFDLGVEKALFNDKVVADVTFFHNRITDLILGFGNTAVNQDGDTNVSGVEVSAQAELLDGLNVGASYTYMKTDDADGNELVRRPRHTAGLTVNYAFLQEKRANANLTLAYNGQQKDNAFGPTRQVTLDDYVLLNIALSYRITDNVQVFARGENLLNQTYQEVYTYGSPGIAGYGGVRVTFEPLKTLGLDK